MPNRVFFPQSALDGWIVAGAVDLRGRELHLLAAGRRYEVDEAVRVLREVSGAGDAAKLVGRVRTRAALEGEGAEVVESSMLFGDAAYDVEPGWVGVPVRGVAGEGPKGDAREREEDLLARFVAENGS